jgi:23S rRNA pseudouridine2605 synthase
MARERLQKIIARAGVASRRAAEELISSGRVRVNGHVVSELGAQADPFKDKIELDGRKLVAEDLVYVVLHKPRLVVSTLSDPEGRPTVAELVRGAGTRVHPVGRLDFHTSGTLLLTNDGEFTNGLLHPRREVPKTYVVKVSGMMGEKDVERWRNGVMLDDGPTSKADVSSVRHEGGKTWMEVTIHEGRNQQIRRMGEATGFPVMRLARLSFAGIGSDGLPPGRWRYLTREELMALREAYGVPRKLPRTPDASVTPTTTGAVVTRRARAHAGGARARDLERDERPAPRRGEGPARGARRDEAPARGPRRGEGRSGGREQTASPRARRDDAPTWPSRGPGRSDGPGASAKASHGIRVEPRPERPQRGDGPRADAKSGGARPAWPSSRGNQKSSAAVPSAKTHAPRGTDSRSPSRSRRPR